MKKLLEDDYFKWLYRIVANSRLRNPSKTYWQLLRILHDKEFVFIVLNDDNRAGDGLKLREEYLATPASATPTQEWLDEGCSMLEMLIALAQRLAFITDEPVENWFWTLIENIHLEVYNDEMEITRSEASTIDDILDDVIWKRHDANGDGGLFPLKHPKKDQRKLEIWHQMNAYLLERW